MKQIIINIYFCVIVLLVIAIIIVLLKWKKSEKRLLSRLAKMLEEAIVGTFTEGTLEESKISEIESDMWRFLSDCKVSSTNLKEQKQRIQSLISDISHQTVTPISNIKIYAELLEEQQDIWKTKYHIVDEDMAEEITAIRSQVEKLDFLIESLVKLSRLENGIVSLKPQHYSVHDVLIATKRQFYKKAEHKSITFIIEDSQEEAEFDMKWTIEAIANIVDNAIKYTLAGGMVKIKAVPYSLFLRIDISDTGIGIAESEITKIFTRFYRSPAVRKQPGVGIGLYLAREVLSMQKGYIKVSSKPGDGSIFSVFLNRG